MLDAQGQLSRKAAFNPWPATGLLCLFDRSLSVSPGG